MVRFVALVACLLVLSALPSAQGAAEQSAPRPVRVGDAISPPARTKHVEPTYPEEALRAGIRGIVIVEIEIDAEGHVRNPRIIRSIPGLDEAALAAVRQWEYEPTLLNGVPTPLIMTVTVNFGLGAGSRGRAGVRQWSSTISAEQGDAGPAGGALGLRPGVEVPLEVAGTPDGVLYRWQITRERAEAQPPWVSHAAPIPLESTDAIELAEMWLGEKDDDVGMLALGGMSLKRMRGPLAADRWYYRVDFDPVVAGHRLPGQGHFTVVVLLDGSIVDPRVDERPLPVIP